MTHKDKQIEIILDQGLRHPTTLQRLSHLVRHLSLQQVFWDVGYSVSFAGLTMVLVLVLFQMVPVEYQTAVAVATTPLSFMVLLLFSELADQVSGLYELKQTTHFQPAQITALRTIVYALVGLIFCGVVSALSSQTLRSFWHLLILNHSALLICSSLMLLLLRRSHSKVKLLLFSLCWVMISFGLSFLFGRSWNDLLTSIPFYLTLVIMVLSSAAFLYQLIHLLSEVSDVDTKSSF